jgi:hypothetical protein
MHLVHLSALYYTTAVLSTTPLLLYHYTTTVLYTTPALCYYSALYYYCPLSHCTLLCPPCPPLFIPSLLFVSVKVSASVSEVSASVSVHSLRPLTRRLTHQTLITPLAATLGTSALCLFIVSILPFTHFLFSSPCLVSCFLVYLSLYLRVCLCVLRCSATRPTHTLCCHTHTCHPSLSLRVDSCFRAAMCLLPDGLSLLSCRVMVHITYIVPYHMYRTISHDYNTCITYTCKRARLIGCVM